MDSIEPGELQDYSNHTSSEYTESDMREAMRGKDLSEQQSGKRFVDDGETIPGRLKGSNDRNLDRPADIRPVLGRNGW